MVIFFSILIFQIPSVTNSRFTYSNSSVTASFSDIGPSGGAIGTISVDPFNSSIVLAGSWYTGIWRSVDSGAIWRRVQGVSDYEVNSITANPLVNGVFYASTISGGLFVSQDGGLTWAHGSVCPYGALKFAVDPQNESIQYAACQFSLLVSHDGGISWIQTSILEPQDIEFSQYSGAVFVLGEDSSGPALFKSLNNGVTWTNNSVDDSGNSLVNSPQSLAVNPSNDSIILVNNPYNTVGTTNGGKSWSVVVNEPKLGMTHGFVAFLNSTVAFSGRVFIFESTDGGKTFNSTSGVGTLDGYDFLNTQNTSGYWNPHEDCGAFAFDSTTHRIYVGTDGGISVSADYGKTWNFLGGSMANGLVTSVGVDPFQNGTLIVSRQDWGPLVSTSEGQSWNAIPSVQGTANSSNSYSEMTLEGGNTAFDPSVPGLVYIAPATCGGNNGVVRSIDHGKTFELLSNGTDGLPSDLTGSIGRTIAIDPLNHSIVWLSYLSSGVFKSIDEGLLWTRMASFNATNIVVHGNLVFADNLTIGSLDLYTLMRSEDGGRTWERLNFTSDVIPISVAIDPNNGNEVYVSYSTRYPGYGSTPGQAGLYFSTDGGNSFTQLSVPSDIITPFRNSVFLLQSINGSTRIILASSTPYINAGGTSDVYLSTNMGESWLRITSNLNVTNVISMTQDPNNPNRIYLATFGEGVVVGLISPNAVSSPVNTSTSSSQETTSTFSQSTNNISTVASSSTAVTSQSGQGIHVAYYVGGILVVVVVALASTAMVLRKKPR